jgi:SulP family sulfate permease
MDTTVIKSGLSAFADRISFRSSDITITPGRIKTELLSGLTVSLALVPEAVAFADPA